MIGGGSQVGLRPAAGTRTRWEKIKQRGAYCVGSLKVLDFFFPVPIATGIGSCGKKTPAVVEMQFQDILKEMSL